MLLRDGDCIRRSRKLPVWPLSQLHALAYNLGNFLRTLATLEPIKDWSLTSLKEKPSRIGALAVSDGRYVASKWPKSPLRNLFVDVARMISEL